MIWIVYLFAGILIAFLLFATLQYSFLIPASKGLPILMYHQISEEGKDALTISLPDLDRQFKYLVEKGYRSISFAELKEWHDQGKSIPPKSVVITFDDGYLNNKTYLLPLLEKYRLKASIFLPLAHLGKVNQWDAGNEPIMDIETVSQIAELPYVEFGIHSFDHKNYKHLSPAEIDEDLRLCDEYLLVHQLKAMKVLAYPYGGTHRKNPETNRQMKEVLASHGYWFGLRIGNRMNKPVLNNQYELFRIDIKGTDSFMEFRIKLKKGHTRLF